MGDTNANDSPIWRMLSGGGMTPSRSNPNDPKSPSAIAAGGTPTQLAAKAAVTAQANAQTAAVNGAVNDQSAELLRQRQRGSLYQGMGATTLTSGTPLGAGGFTGKTLLGS